MPNFLSILSLLIGLIGLIASAYFYRRTRSVRDPMFIVDPSRIQILSSEQVADVPIKVFKKDGSEVRSDLTGIRFYFWNEGTKSIRSNSVLDPIIIKLDDPNAEIIDSKLLKVSREVTKIEFETAEDDPKRKLLMTFSILERNDGVTGQIIYEGNPNADLKIFGIIEEVDRIKSQTDVTTSTMFVRNRLSWIVIGMVTATVTAAVYFEFRVRSVLHQYGSLPGSVGVFRYILPFVVVAYSTWALWMWLRLCQKNSKNPVGLVPSGVWPEK